MRYLRTKFTFATILSIITVFFLNANFFNYVHAQTYMDLSADKVKALLRCPSEESMQYVDDAFELVRQGKVPESILLSAFNSSYKRPKNKWMYFQIILPKLCDQIGIDYSQLRATLTKQ
ncbi:MAG: hypothetical protein Q4C96_05400 [Planctomycetia bacterium]|nr:hypothetical protein [Planctomycetia bacterium]